MARNEGSMTVWCRFCKNVLMLFISHGMDPENIHGYNHAVINLGSELLLKLGVHLLYLLGLHLIFMIFPFFKQVLFLLLLLKIHARFKLVFPY